MDKKLIRIQNQNNELYVYWIITDFCNQACSYCIKSLHGGEQEKKNPLTSSEFNILSSKIISTLKEKNLSLNLTISGGEPTVIPLLPEILSTFSPYGLTEIITNGTRNVAWWETLPVLPNKVIISLHPEYYDSKKIRINELANFLTNNNVSLQFNLMCLPSKWDVVMDIMNDIDDKYKQFIVPKVIQHIGTFERDIFNYTKEQLSWIKAFKNNIPSQRKIPIYAVYSDNSKKNCIPNKLMADYEHFFEDWKCSAGYDSIQITPVKNVFAGICRAKKLGPIDTFELENDYITCPRPSCVCPADILLDKYDPLVRPPGIEPGLIA